MIFYSIHDDFLGELDLQKPCRITFSKHSTKQNSCHQKTIQMWQTHRHWGPSPSAQTRRIGLSSSLCGGRWRGGGGWERGRSRRRATMASVLRGRRAMTVASGFSAVSSQRNGLHHLRYDDTRKKIIQKLFPSSFLCSYVWYRPIFGHWDYTLYYYKLLFPVRKH